MSEYGTELLRRQLNGASRSLSLMLMQIMVDQTIPFRVKDFSGRISFTYFIMMNAIA
jgi:hypothetical protein